MPRKNTKADKDIPQFVAGQQGGWNQAARKWMTKDGRFSTKAKALEDIVDSDFSGGAGMIKLFYNTPITNAFGRFEVASSNLSEPIDEKTPYTGLANILQAALSLAQDPARERPANYMLPQVQTRLRLAEHFYQTEGDASNTCDVPVEIISRGLIVDCSDGDLRKDIEEFIADNNLEDTVSELWRTMRVYGQAFPYEAWDNNGKTLTAIVNLYPIHVHVGYNWGFWLGPEMVGEKAWTEALVKSRMPPALHRPLLRHWNENPPPQGGSADMASGMPLSGDVLHPIRDKDFNWTRYSMPMLSRGFRDLTSRVVHEDAIRAVTEGYRYQMWVFKLGDKDHPPLPQEIKALQNALAGVSGERTGMLVWRDSPLTIQILVPEGLDKLLGNDYLGYLTKAFFRKMGITSQVVSGESPGQLATLGGRGATTDLDVQIYVERIRYQADQITRWIEYIVKKWVRANMKPVKPLSNLKIKFEPTVLEMESRISKVFLPMYESGNLSVRTILASAGLNYETELANKREESKHKDFWMPPVTYAQAVTNAQGETTQVAQPKSKGSPDKAGETRNKMGKGKPASAKPVMTKVKADV